MSAPSPPLRVAVLHGTNYWNMGDLGLMVALVQRLHAAGDVEIVSLSRFYREPRPDGQTFTIERLDVREVPFLALPHPRLRPRALHVANLAFRALGLGLAARLTAVGLGRIVPDAMSRRLRPLMEADVVISKPGGFLHHHMAIDHLLQIWIATLTGRPVVIYGQSIGPFSGTVQRFVVARVLRRCRTLLVRDEPSREACIDRLHLPPDRVRLTADEAFLLEAAGADDGERLLREAGVERGRPLIGLTVIQWPFPGAADPAAAHQRYMDAMVGLVDHVHERHDADVALFTFTTGRDYGRNDEGVTAELVRRARHPNRVHRIAPGDPRTLKAAIGQLDAFVGSRMHSNIFALGAGTPVLAIAYLPKTTGIMSMVGLARHVVGIDEIERASLASAFDTLWRERAEVRAHLARALPDIRESARTNARVTLEIAEETT